MVMLIENFVRFKIMKDGITLFSDLSACEVREHIYEFLLNSELKFSPTLQEHWNEDTDKLEIFMHSDNWEDEENYEKYESYYDQCEELGFSDVDDEVATHNILKYLGIEVIFTHIEQPDNTKINIPESYQDGGATNV
ncbi:hypothetical protein ACFSCX_05850 [Bacillus salitolerans]|uniref:Uncharacterized protein n=1 Tax=Bacillus salitolerans TaxID=1437434 RepID=A0ABW4LLQ4_9BACI